MNELKNWNEVTRGLYRYVISSNVCYEIHVLYHSQDTNVLTAKSSLFLVGLWRDSKDSCGYFERECLLEEQPLFECLEMAVKDNDKNNKIINGSNSL